MKNAVANRVRLPDFIIGGAPKCATTSLHHILAEHEEIGMPAGEFGFFDADDPITHPDFFFVHGGDLVAQDCESADGLFLRYAERFRPFQDARFIGEDSTTYLSSPVAAARIKRALPDVKLIFMLRDPVERTYSQYWHMVNSGRAAVSFERALTVHPNLVLGSTYRPQLDQYLKHFRRDQMKIVLFEDFVRDRDATVDGVTEFIGAARMDQRHCRKWSNRTPYPAFPRLLLLANRIRSRLMRERYRHHLGVRYGRLGDAGWLAGRAIRRIVPNIDHPPPIREPTRAYLVRHLSERNRGLSELLGRDFSLVWKGFTG